MQPRNLAPEAEVDEDDELEVELLLDEAELWLLPHPAKTSAADTAIAAVAHTLRFTLTSTEAVAP
jgi:hypothetical protein